MESRVELQDDGTPMGTEPVLGTRIEEKMLKIFTDHNYLTPEHRRNIFPLLFDLFYKPNQNVIDRYQIVATLQEADIAIVPVGISYYFKVGKSAELYKFIDTAVAKGKKVWLYSDGDFGITISKDVYTFRLGGFDSKLDDNTFILPSFIQDPYKTLQSDFFAIPKSSLPQIGFVGNADGSWLKFLKELIIYAKQTAQRVLHIRRDDHQGFFPSSIVRYRLLSKLAKEKQIKTDFILRKKYRAGAITTQDRKRTELEFLQNIANNPYTLCVRGSGNFSVRFFETIAMGRIPLLIATDNRLPLSGKIDWNKHCVIATESDYIAKLVQFHGAITAGNFELMQKNNRELWSDWLTREAYFLTFADYFTDLK